MSGRREELHDRRVISGLTERRLDYIRRGWFKNKEKEFYALVVYGAEVPEKCEAFSQGLREGLRDLPTLDALELPAMKI